MKLSISNLFKRLSWWSPALALLILAGCSGNVGESKATVADADKFLADAEKRYFDSLNKLNRASWVKSTFITDDTEAIEARTNEENIALVTELAETARKFDGMKLSPDAARKLKLLKLARLLVLRNGMMIGSAPVRLEGPVTGTSAFVRQSDESGAAAWLEVPIPEAIAAKVPERFAGRVDIAADLRALLEPLITVGTSVIVTPDSLRTSSPPPVEILGGDEGNALIDRVEARIDALPGLAGLGLVRTAIKTATDEVTQTEGPGVLARPTGATAA